MKVVIVRNAFVYDFGGAERLAVHIAEEIKQHGVDAMVLSRQPRLLAYATTHGVPCHKAVWWNRQNWSGRRALLFPTYLLWQLVLYVWYLCVLLRFRPDVLHLMSKDDFIAGTWAAKTFHRGVVWTDPADLKHVFSNNTIWYRNPVGKLVYAASKQADTITLVSESERRLVAEAVGTLLPERFVVMHTAGKDESVKPEARSSRDKGAVIFCSTSRLVKAKGISELVQAFNELSQGSDKYRLWLVGNGPDEERFRKEAGDNPYITFVGHSDHPLSYVAASDVFVHPTYHEGFSLSLAEAAMLGKPLIATNVGGNPELVHNGNGTLVPAKNPRALCDAMARLGSNSALRANMGRVARKDYINKFDFATIVKTKLIPVYEQAKD
jgi:glycosyltransferase involved in cell wall biosynthesis